MLANKLGRGLLAMNRFGLSKTRSVHYRGEFWEKNVNRLQRPLSPHLSAYRMPFTALTSITFRVCGAGMTVAVLSFGAGSFFFAGNFDKVCNWVQQNVHPHVLLTGKFILSFPIVWHMFFGLRHLVWDNGHHYVLKNVMTSGRALMALAILGTIVLALSDL